MPRTMPALASTYCSEVDRALRLASAFEVARATSPVTSTAYQELTIARLERAYELAFLRMYAQWEVFLEEVTARYLLGYVSTTYTPTLLIDKPKNLDAARRQLAGGRDYCLWHNPDTVTRRVNTRLQACPVATVVASSRTQLEAMAAVRHRVAHHSYDARDKFDTATMRLSGVRVPGARAGRFLRREVTTSARWIESLGTQLKGLAQQIAP